MGYVNLKKAAGDFDILSDAGVATVKLVGGNTDTGKIEIIYFYRNFPRQKLCLHFSYA